MKTKKLILALAIAMMFGISSCAKEEQLPEPIEITAPIQTPVEITTKRVKLEVCGGSGGSTNNMTYSSNGDYYYVYTEEVEFILDEGEYIQISAHFFQGWVGGQPQYPNIYIKIFVDGLQTGYVEAVPVTNSQISYTYTNDHN